MELADIFHLTSRLETKVRILFRIGDFTGKTSRFGFSKFEVPKLIEFAKNNDHIFICEGFSFHLDGYSIEERAIAIQEAIKYIKAARKSNMPCSVINIGGGYAVNYITKEYGKKISTLNSSDFFSKKMPDNFYPYYSPISGENFLKAILDTVISESRDSIGDMLINEKCRLVIEPGRALLHQTGITCCSVRESRITPSGDNIINVNANINMLSEQWFGTDFLPGPVLVTSGLRQSSPYSASIGGNTCMEIDLITKRKINFPFPPRHGDILAYLNTAGYQMDSNESTFHQIPLPQKIAIFRKKHENWQYKQDTYFSQLDI